MKKFYVLVYLRLIMSLRLLIVQVKIRFSVHIHHAVPHSHCGGYRAL